MEATFLNRQDTVSIRQRRTGGLSRNQGQRVVRFRNSLLRARANMYRKWTRIVYVLELFNCCVAAAWHLFRSQEQSRDVTHARVERSRSRTSALRRSGSSASVEFSSYLTLRLLPLLFNTIRIFANISVALAKRMLQSLDLVIRRTVTIMSLQTW